MQAASPRPVSRARSLALSDMDPLEGPRRDLRGLSRGYSGIGRGSCTAPSGMWLSESAPEGTGMAFQSQVVLTRSHGSDGSLLCCLFTFEDQVQWSLGLSILGFQSLKGNAFIKLSVGKCPSVSRVVCSCACKLPPFPKALHPNPVCFMEHTFQFLSCPKSPQSGSGFIPSPRPGSQDPGRE